MSGYIRPWYEEEVNGTVIGGFDVPYEFWTRDGMHRLAKGHFETDAEAVAWFQEKYPAEFKAGAEMRVFDQSFATRAQAKP